MRMKLFLLLISGFLYSYMPISAYSAQFALASEQPDLHQTTAIHQQDWVQSGWDQVDHNNIDAALASWQQGVNQLPPEQLLAFLGVYTQLPAAVKQLERGGLSEKLIIVHSAFKGKRAYYVLSARDVPTNKSVRRKKLASLYRVMNMSGTIYADAAGKFQTAGEGLASARLSSMDEKEIFKIGAFDVIGNTLVSDDSIQNGLKDYLGEDKTRDDLIAAKQTILKLYRDAGYETIAVGLPHHITAETISIRIFEVSIGEIWVSGKTKDSVKSIKSSFPGLKPGEVAKADVLDEQLRAFCLKKNVKSAKLVYHPNDKGLVDVEIKVNESNPMKLGIMASSLGTQETGRVLFTGILYHNNVWNAGHELTLSYTGSENIRALRLYSFKYAIPIQATDGKFTVKYSRADVASGQILGMLDTRGDGTLKSIHYEQTIFRTDTSRHYLDLGYEQHLFHDRFMNAGEPVSFTVGILASPIVLSYGYEGVGDYGEFGIYASYYHNTPVGTQKRTATYQLINPAAVANWSYYRLRASYNYDWQNDWSFHAKFSGQLSNNALTGGERFYITGMFKARGFEEAEASGDTAFFLRTELTTPNWLHDTRFHAFVDAGRYRLNFPFPAEFASDSIVSTGLGAHWTPASGLDVSLEAGVVLNGLPVAPNGSVVGHFKVIYWFQ